MLSTLSKKTENFTLAWVESLRVEATRKLPQKDRGRLGQFLTPDQTARFMASMFGRFPGEIRVLDPGAGVGSLTAAFVLEALSRKKKPKSIHSVVYEIDRILVDYLERVLSACRHHCEGLGVAFSYEIRHGDFIEDACARLHQDLFGQESEDFTHVITNPPYRKINTGSRERALVSEAGLETSNLYSAFVFLAGELLGEGGELVAITPRSFCNGPYFRPFRECLVGSFVFRRCHVFESRNKAFGDDDVLQENVIFAARKGGPRGTVLLSSSEHPGDEAHVLRELDHDELVDPADPNLFFHLATDGNERKVAEVFSTFTASLSDLGVTVSTGRVVDFRANGLLHKEPGKGTVPLLYPAHMRDGGIRWPVADFKKYNAISDDDASRSLLVPSGTYVLTKRFSAKEEARRVVAAVLTPDNCPGERVGIENHLNYFHAAGAGLESSLAKGLCIFLNSTLLDRFFRQFSGHTQVNATDLRNIRYPDADTLRRLGRKAVKVQGLKQERIDRMVMEELFDDESGDPLGANRRIDEALNALKELGLPREQQNERSALTLLALLNLTPDKGWEDAANPLCGITQMMSFFKEHYGKTYAPNTRETVRRFTMHQFVQAGLAVENPDRPDRPTNSPKWCYQVAPEFLDVLRRFGTKTWRPSVKKLLVEVVGLKERYARERDMLQIPIQLAPGKEVKLSPGGQNVLIKQIVEEFCPLYTPAGQVLYVGDSAAKWGYYDSDLLASLNVEIEQHGKMPDVVVFMKDKNWLVLIEAVTSHGPVNPKRHVELKELFEGCTAGLVFVSAFPDKKTLNKYLGEIAWETDVWCADSPTHLIHFNGERFLGPYE